MGPARDQRLPSDFGVLILLGLDHVDDPALRADRVRVVPAHVLPGQLVDVVPRLLAVDGPDDRAAHLGPVPRIIRRVQQHRHPRVPADVLAALALRLGVDKQVLAVGVDPGEQRLRLAVRHQGDHGGQVAALGETGDVLIERHVKTPESAGGTAVSVGATTSPARSCQPPHRRRDATGRGGARSRARPAAAGWLHNKLQSAGADGPARVSDRKPGRSGRGRSCGSAG